MATDEERLLVRIEAQLRQFEKAMAQATGGADRAARRIENRFKQMERTLGGVGRGLGQVLGVSIGIASFRQLAIAIDRTVSQAEGLVDLADKIGITTDALQELRFQADQQGSSADALDAMLEQFSKRIGLAAAGSGELLDILNANGIALRDNEGNLRPLVDLLADYADLIKNASNDQDRAVLSLEGFGKAGDEAANVFRNGAAGIEEFKTKAHDLNQVVGGEGVRTLADYADEIAKVKGQFNTFWTDLIIKAIEANGWFDKLNENLDGFLLPAEASTNDKVTQLTEELVAAEAELAALEAQGIADTNFLEPYREQAALLRAEIASLTAATAAGVVSSGPGTGQGAFAGRPKPTAAAPATTIPSRAGGGGGKSPADQFEEDIARIRERTEALRVEIGVIGESVFEQERALAVQDLLNEAKRAGVEITPELRKEIEAEAAAYAASVEALDRAEERFRALNDLAEEFGNQSIEAIEGFLDGTKTLNESLADTLKMLRRMVLEAVLLGQGPLAGLFGGGGAGGGVGGLLGKLFGGFRASGGPVLPGRAYVVGEKGPEILMPSAAGNVVSGGGSGGGGIVDHVVRVEPSPFFVTTVHQAVRSEIGIFGKGQAQQQRRYG